MGGQTRQVVGMDTGQSRERTESVRGIAAQLRFKG